MTWPPDARRLRALVLLLVALIVSLGTALGPPTSDARLREASGRWAFRGHDFNDESAIFENDPMTILYKGGRSTYTGERRETTPAIKNMLFDDWEDGDMREHPLCLRGKWFWYWNHPGSDAYHMDETDLNMSTSGTCKNQWHTRIWNDREINENAQWEVGGIHREVRSFRGGHRLNMSFELAEQKAVGYMSRFCSLRNWRALPGSGPRKFHGFYSNGKISRISMSPVDHSKPSGSKCRGAFR